MKRSNTEMRFRINRRGKEGMCCRTGKIVIYYIQVNPAEKPLKTACDLTRIGN